ncbi:hypothetical protein V1477_012013, partial [Vespula maculifrons]
MEVLIDVVISQISDCSNEKVATIATTINSNDDCVAFITLSLEKKVRSLRISQDDVVETEYGVCNLEQNLHPLMMLVAVGTKAEKGRAVVLICRRHMTFGRLWDKNPSDNKIIFSNDIKFQFHRTSIRNIIRIRNYFLPVDHRKDFLDFSNSCRQHSQETFDLGRGRRRDFRKRRTTDAFSVKSLVVASSLVNLRGKQVLTVRTSKTSPRNSNGMQLYVGASTGPKPSPDTRTL